MRRLAVFSTEESARARILGACPPRNKSSRDSSREPVGDTIAACSPRSPERTGTGSEQRPLAGQFTWKGRLLRRILARRGATVVHLISPEARRDLEIIRATQAAAPLLIEDAAGFELLAHVRAARRLGGAMAEAGVFAGGSARLICEAKGALPLHLFDVFETLQPSPGDREGGPRTTRAFELRDRFGSWHTPRAAVERLLGAYPEVHFHPGIFPDTTAGLEDQRFSFVHLDLDLEPSTRDALAFFYPRLLPGGFIIGDDYNLDGVRAAFESFFASRPDPQIVLPWSQVVVVKLRD